MFLIFMHHYMLEQNPVLNLHKQQVFFCVDDFTTQFACQEAEEQEEIQRQIAAEKQEYHRLESEVNKLQQQLRQSQQVLEMVVASANEKTEQTQAVKERQCTVRDLLSYAHLISSSYSNQMPANWTEMDYRRPWPTDLGQHPYTAAPFCGTC